MPTFSDAYTLPAPLQAVANFHCSTAALPALTPPPVFVQIHHMDPLAEGSRSEFSLWFGPLPIRWLAIHSNVDYLHGFTDTQLQGPLKFWRHTHRFIALAPDLTEMQEQVEYEYQPGLAGLLGRLLFSPPALSFMFAYRRLALRRALRSIAQRPVPTGPS
jgi:ligand-binding SRPBCC domain-containing protein